MSTKDPYIPTALTRHEERLDPKQWIAKEEHKRLHQILDDPDGDHTLPQHEPFPWALRPPEP